MNPEPSDCKRKKRLINIFSFDSIVPEAYKFIGNDKMFFIAGSLR